MSLPPPTPVTCYRHPSRATGRACTRCGRPACTDCLTPAAVGSQCAECIRESRPSTRETMRRWGASRPTLMTKVFIGVSVAVFLLSLVGGGGLGELTSSRINDVQRDFGLNPILIDAGGEWWRIFTSGFVHFGLLHLAMNMLVIYQVSLMLEPALGPVRYTLTYLSCLVGGSAGALILTDNPRAITAGASGVAFGLVGCAVAGMIIRKIPIMRTNLGGLLLINLVLTFAIPGISIGGHIGGLVAGFLCGLVLMRPHRGPPPVWDMLVPFLLGLAGVALSFWAAAQWPTRL